MNSQLITIFEDYSNNVSCYKEHLQNLYSLRDIVKSNCFSLQTDGTLRISHYVGFYQKGNTRLQILPKVYLGKHYNTESDDEINKSLEFVYRLLCWSGYPNIKHLNPQAVSSKDSDLLEIFIGIFIDEFIKLFRRTIYQKYELQEENTQIIKGKILFSESLKRNVFSRHLHYIQFDEFTINNPLNQFFKFVILSLLKKTNSSTSKQKLVLGLAYLQEVDAISPGPNFLRLIRFDRLNNQFQPLFNLAKLFFHNLQPGMSEGSEDTFSFLVPLHLLFENFIGKALMSLSDSELEFKYHFHNIYYGNEGTKQVFQLEPDFTLKKNEQYVSILDTKYKYPFDQNRKPAIDVKDLYQLSTYATAYNCKSLFLIYPKFIDAPVQDSLLTEYKLRGAFGEITLKIIQVDIMESNLGKISNEIRNNIITKVN